MGINMADFKILTDSSADLTPELIAKYGATVVSLDVMFEGEPSIPNEQVDVKEFYVKLRSKKNAKTSAVNTEKFIQHMKPILDGGHDLLCLIFSSGLSATYNCARIAVDELSGQYPQRKICLVDTLSASMGQGLLINYAYEQKMAGKSVSEVYTFVEDLKMKLCHWFTVDDLFFLKRGGRVSAATAIAGTALALKPVMHMDNEGHLTKVSVAKGRKGSLKGLLEKMKETAINPQEQTIFISHGDCLEDAQYLADMIKAQIGVKEILISFVGPVIGAHSGPGTVALFFVGTER
jgi:DegV family protein with EDD domain